MAKYVYPAVFTHEAEGGYSITFPDLPDCATSAETLEEGIEMAADALCLMLYDMEEGGAVPPEPSDVRSIVCADGGKTGGQFFHDPAKCTESGAAYLTDDKQESGDRVVSALFCCAQTFNSCFSAACRMAETFSPASLAAAFSQDGKVTFRRTVRFSLARR